MVAMGRSASSDAPRRPRRGAGAAGTGPHVVGDVTLVPDPGPGRAWTVLVGGIPSSHVDLDDPRRLDFEYMRWMGDVLDLAAEAGARLRVVHLGGGGCTMARYVAATRPGSRQDVVEIDPDVARASQDVLGRPRGARVRVHVDDGRARLARLPSVGRDAVIRDAFDGANVPDHLCTVEFVRDVARVLTPAGVYLANIADRPPLRFARAEAATALEVFAHVALVAEPAQLKGRRYGNVVLVASSAPLPVAALDRRLASGAVRSRLLDTPQVRVFASGHRPLRDDPPPAVR
jgi:spermidine synthase